MANRKILIEFTANPTTGNAFSYNIIVGETPFLYPNGQTTLNLDYVSGSDVAFTSIGLKTTLSETIDNTLNFLVQYFNSPFITYTRVDNTIEVFLNFDNAVVTYPDDTNENVLISDDAYNPDITYKLKYLTEWADAENVPYSVRIYKKGFTGSSTSVSGYAVLKYGSVKENLEAIRGNGLDLNLNASTDLTLEDLYTEEENSFAVKMYRRNKLLFDGYLKPDGVYQSFVQDQWMLSLSCVDGLGLLKDLAFVQPNGLHWTGKQRAIDIIYNCLRRTGLQMNINTSVNIYYTGQNPSDTLDPLHEVFLSVDRFIKDDNETIMDCNEVLTSVLNLFNAVICQMDGQWYVFRPNELYISSLVKFRQYSETNNNYIGLNSKNLTFNLGSQVDNYYPHHAGGNQQIEIKGSVSAARINYKYGFISGISANKNLDKTYDEYGYPVYSGWEWLNYSKVIDDPLDNSGIITKPINGNTETPVAIIRSDALLLNAGNLIDIRFMVTKTNFDELITYEDYGTITAGPPLFTSNYIIQVGAYFLIYDSPTGFYVWTTSPTSENTFIQVSYYDKADITLELPPLPVDGNLVVTICETQFAVSFGYIVTHTNAEYTLVEVINKSTTNAKTGAIGEFHTVQRQNRPSSISKDTKVIYNGDSPSLIYDGAIFESNGITPTNFWTRRGFNRVDGKPLLRIYGEDILQMSQKPAKVFSGDIYGYMPYLSVISINNLSGKFMPIEWSFNAQENITSVKLLEIFNDYLFDIDYKYTLDYGNTVKPTITS